MTTPPFNGKTKSGQLLYPSEEAQTQNAASGMVMTICISDRIATRLLGAEKTSETMTPVVSGWGCP